MGGRGQCERSSSKQCGAHISSGLDHLGHHEWNSFVPQHTRAIALSKRHTANSSAFPNNSAAQAAIAAQYGATAMRKWSR
jgi:hypothetical protein